MKLKSVVMGLSMAMVAFVLLFAVIQGPSFGSIRILPLKFYLSETLLSTGALNTVAALVWDWRGYDTLGETTVFFAAAIGTIVLFRLGRGSH
jgi:multicomponent Na+:H+ antiporter subunit B